MAEVVERFGLGRLTAEPVPVPGGLSNDLWQVITEDGAYAVKRMLLNADRPDFVANVEAAYEIERRALHAGVAMPEPVPDPLTGRALSRVREGLFRVHRWAAGEPGVGPATDAAELLATIHAAGRPRWGPPEPPWDGTRWGAEIAGLARRVAAAPDRVLVVDSHRDLDPKNTLRRPDGVLLALDWDAAGPAGAVQEAAAVAVDWSDGDQGAFAAALLAYERRGGTPVPREPWVFGGWVAAQGGWLDHQSTHGGDAEVEATLARLQKLDVDQLLRVTPAGS
jgi:hypothetical protein